MVDSSHLLILAAASIGIFHTLFGPDHYLPFIVMGKARGWSRKKTLAITFLCGVGHVASSVLLGFIGLAFGIAVFRLESIEAVRGEAAAWLLFIFGFTYLVWGTHRGLRGKPHTHIHAHGEGSLHSHPHPHKEGHAHVHEKKNITPWILFTIFVFGPCEPLIPLLMYPAAAGSAYMVAAVTITFSLATISTMLAVVAALSYGIDSIPLQGLDVWTHSLAGAAITLSAAGMIFLGL